MNEKTIHSRPRMILVDGDDRELSERHVECLRRGGLVIEMEVPAGTPADESPGVGEGASGG